MKLHILFQGGVPKKAEPPDSNQDAFCVNEAFDNGCLRLSIADGVSQSFMQATWARVLTRRFCISKDVENTNLFEEGILDAWIEGARSEWEEEVSKSLAYRPERTRDRILEKLDAGENAAATFLGLEITQTPRGDVTWKAIIIGDSCLFLVNRDRFDSYLLSASDDFSLTPDYLLSTPGVAKGVPFLIKGEAKKGDVFLLATDALGRWILQNKEKTNKNFSSSGKFGELTSIKNWDQFYKFVNYYRSSRPNEVVLEDDDTTLVSLAVGLIPRSRQIPEIFRKIEEQTIEDYFSFGVVQQDVPGNEPEEKPIVAESTFLPSRRSEVFSRISIAISLISFLFALLSLFVISKTFQAPATQNTAIAPGIPEFIFPSGSSLYSNPGGEPVFYFAPEYITTSFSVVGGWILTDFTGWIWVEDSPIPVNFKEDTAPPVVRTVEMTDVFAEPTSKAARLGLVPPDTEYIVLESMEDLAGEKWAKVLIVGYFENH